MSFAEELLPLLPEDLPHAEQLAVLSSKHLDMIVEVNQYMNLTRVTGTREAVIKHVLDSILPWNHFAGARSILDAGTGAGLPGIPLAVIFPETRFLLVESVQKKARFVESVVESLQLKNVEVSSKRAEELLLTRKVEIITARAMAPIERALGYFAPAFRNGSKALLYKGPDAETEIAEAANEARKRKVVLRVVARYDLPDSLGTRTLVEAEST